MPFIYKTLYNKHVNKALNEGVKIKKWLPPFAVVLITLAILVIGCITGILISKYFILQDISLYSISGTYAALGAVLLVIMALMLFAHMPALKPAQGPEDELSLKATFGRLFQNKRYAWGVVAQFFYIGAQTGTWSFAIRLSMLRSVT